MKASELRKLSREELETKLSEAREEQMRRRCNQAILQVSNNQTIRQGRRDIARLKTVLNHKIKTEELHES